jgi:hypothetical protein
MKVCIYGTPELGKDLYRLVAELAYTLGDLPALVVTGGFLRRDDDRYAVSTDSAALEGSRRYAQERNKDLTSLYEAWIPEPRLDGRSSEGVVRMTEKEGITVRVVAGRTALGRRLAMVSGVDMVVTIGGRVHTETVIEQALETGVPVLPIPNAGGDSEALLRNYRQRIAACFEEGALERCLDNITANLATDAPSAARAIVDLIGTARLGRCLALFPYDDEHKKVFARTLRKSIERHMIPVRLDLLPKSDAIYSTFAEEIRKCSAVVADVTQLNDNVMYEVGYAYGLGITPLLYTRREDRLANLPVYLKTLNIRLALEEDQLDRLVDDYLLSIKRKR